MSSSKFDADTVESILRQQELDHEKIVSIMNDLKEFAEANATPPAPREKKQFVVVVSDPEGKLNDMSLVGWVFKVPEDVPFVKVPELLAKAAREFNQTKKGRRLPAKTFGEACEAVPAKLCKEQEGLQVVTKEPLSFVRTDNSLLAVGEAQ
jgi:hypothetical protein